MSRVALGAIFVSLLAFSSVAFGADVILTVQDLDGSGAVSEALRITAERFQRDHPNVEVVLDRSCTWEQCWNTNVVMTAAGALPDVVHVYAEVRNAFIVGGVLMNISDYIQQRPEILESLLPPLLGAMEYEGNYWGIPEIWSANAANVNLTVFQNAGLLEPSQYFQQGDWTFDGVRNIAARMTVRNNDEGYSQIGVFSLDDYRLLLPWVWGFGASAFNEDVKWTPSSRHKIEAS